MNNIYYYTDSYKSSLVLSFSFFPFHFLAIAFFLSFSFFSSCLFPLPFHFTARTSSLRSTNGNNLREGYNYLKTMSHSLLSLVWKIHDFSVHTADQLRQNCLAQNSSEGTRSCLFQPKKKKKIITYYSLWSQNNRFLRDVQAAVHLSKNQWAWWLPNPAGFSRTAQKL